MAVLCPQQPVEHQSQSKSQSGHAAMSSGPVTALDVQRVSKRIAVVGLCDYVAVFLDYRTFALGRRPVKTLLMGSQVHYLIELCIVRSLSKLDTIELLRKRMDIDTGLTQIGKVSGLRFLIIFSITS